MKKVIVGLFFLLIASQVYAYVDMSHVGARANDLNMRKKDYADAMAMAGTALGFIFGLFLWKVR